MAILYRSDKGFDVSRHSYSAGQEFSRCKRLYYLKRLVGWREKDDRSTARFGRCLEDSIQFFHEHGCQPGSTAEKFTDGWGKVRQIVGVTYKDDTWEEMLAQGQQMARLYEIRLPSLPIVNPKFQLAYRKEVYPNTYLAGIEFVAYVDILSSPQSGRLIVDIKTSGMALKTPLLVLDPQLRSYAWISGIPDVAFLWFERMGLYLKKGDTVTTLEGVPTGEELRVLAVDKDNGVLNCLTPELYEEYQKKSEGLKGKAADAIKQEYIEHGLDYGVEQVTKQRLHFYRGTIPPEDMAEAGEVIGREIAEIVSAREKNFFPKEGGVRFPNNACEMCAMRGVCANDKALQDELLIPPDSENSWLDELQAED